jgi:uncharacterized membrane protein
MKVIRIVCVAGLLLASLLLVFPSGAVLAQDEEAKDEELAEDTIELTATHTKLEATSGGSFEFEVKMTYKGTEDRIFDLTVTGPKDWLVYTTPNYPKDKRIKDIRLEGEKGFPETILIHANSPFWLNPDPGDYKITAGVASGELTGAIDLTAVITARYELGLLPAIERYNTKVTAGKDNFFSAELMNEGSATIDDITFSSDKPEGWTIEFTPDEVSALAAGKTKTIDINIKPAAKAIAGDYSVAFRAASEQATAQKLEIRVTVETPTIWGWTGIGIIVIVIAGLALIIMRFSRR